MPIYRPFIPSRQMVKECLDEDSGEIRELFESFNLPEYQYINYKNSLLSYVDQEGYGKFPERPTYPHSKKVFLRNLPQEVFMKPISAILSEDKPKRKLNWIQRILSFLGIIKKNQ